MRKIFISSDHAGYKLKEHIKLHLSKKKISFKDMGPYNDSRVDYPDFAHKVARKVKLNKNSNSCFKYSHNFTKTDICRFIKYRLTFYW